ncbi:nuclear transport factor 2 family protein [Candidatus Poriferisocius sp.]|uniref:nuclear transport factor 2 family protein n=1 Tax=Candidatus Poriferisocius sp. TaxID=3101276 RepID=UPI003B02BD74
MSDSISTGALEALVAKQAITEVIYGYCRALDRMDKDAAYEVWHADGTADYGEDIFKGTGRRFVDWVWTAHAAMSTHSHQITNVLIQVDGSRAASEAYVTVALRTLPFGDAAEVADIFARGRYLDQWSRRDGRWAIDHRDFITDHSVTVPNSNPDSHDPRSIRGPEDLSVALFG